MLRQVFQTVPVPYMKRGDPLEPGYLLGVQYHPNVEPYIEDLIHPSGVFAHPNPLGVQFNGAQQANLGPPPTSPVSIYVFTLNEANWWPSWTLGFYRFDGTSGKFIHRMSVPTSLLGGLTTYSTQGYRSRSGYFWFNHIWHTLLIGVNLGDTAQSLMGSEPKKPDGLTPTGNNLSVTRFEDLAFFSSALALDDKSDYFLHASGRNFQVYVLSTGKKLYDVDLPGTVVDIALEEADHAYILLDSRVLVLFDYLRNEVLGATKVPTLLTEADTIGGNNNVRISWDTTFRRLLVIEKTLNNTDGSSTMVVRGYRAVPEPIRMTIPIPLKKPRQRRIIPVLTQIVGDMNEGIGGYLVNATATGSGTVVGLPITDAQGNGFIQVACEGSPYFDEYPEYDWSVTGSPEAGSPEGSEPHAGLITIEASVRVYMPDPKEIHISGAPGTPPGPPGVPGPPGGGSTPGGGGGGDLPETAPNMKYILDRVFASKVWNFAESNQQNPDGRGQFTHEAVQAIHDVDARFGHIDKHRMTWYHPTGGRGHAVDALVFKCDDGTTAEIYDIAGGNADSKPAWHFSSRSADNLDKWFYPCPL